jgi:tetratricopeptide (TPR) repeat protein
VDRLGAGRQTANASAQQAFERAVRSHSQGRLAEAEQHYKLALQANGDNLDAVYHLALLRLQQGRMEDAWGLLERVVEKQPRAFAAHHHLGVVLASLARWDAAVNHYEQALAINPDAPETNNNLGHALQSMGRLEEAALRYEKAVALNPAYPEARNNLGNVLHLLGRSNEALSHFRAAIQTAPRYGDAHVNLGHVLVAVGKPEEAVAHYEIALAVQPRNPDTRISLALTLLMLDRGREAGQHCDAVVAMQPRSLGTLANLAFLLLKLQRPEQALSVYDRVLVEKPDHMSALVNRAALLHALGRFDESLIAYAKAQKVDSSNAAAHHGEGLLRLQLGDLPTGFEKYERRWEKDQLQRRSFDKPLWRGQEIAGKTILLHAEQGFGDTLQFCRYAELLAGRGARVVLEVQPALKSLLETLPGANVVVASGDQLPEVDFCCPMASLPLAFGTTLQTIPGKTPYLAASAERIASWERRLKPKTKPRVGLVWSGNPIQGNDHNRSIPLGEIDALLSLPNVEIVSLQKNLRKRDLALLKANPRIIHFGDELQDFSDTAAVLSLMDVVVSVCTSVCHLSGALNRPTWVLLSAACDWRWLLDRTDSPWYPSVRLFRQNTLGDWQSVIGAAASELAQLK